MAGAVQGPARTLIPYGEMQQEDRGRCKLRAWARQRDLGYAALSASVAVGRPCAPSQARTMPASSQRLVGGHHPKPLTERDPRTAANDSLDLSA